MKIVRFFIASSIDEFKTERIFIGDFVRRFNIIANEKGHHIRLFLCEDESSNMQRIYDYEIESSNIFVAFIGNHIGKWTFHEIEDIALRSSSIFRKVIFSKGIVDLPKEWTDSFELRVFKEDFLNKTIETLKKIFEYVCPLLPDKIIENKSNIFWINTIDTGIDLINAIIGNIVRSYNDQYGSPYRICIEDDLSKQICDAYVAIISDNDHPEAEEQYVQNLLKRNIPLGSLWIFTNTKYADIDIVILLREVHNKYVELFKSDDEFSQLFRLRLIYTILDKIRLNSQLNLQFSQEYTYIVENHFLKRVSLVHPENEIIIKNLLNVDSNLDSLYRKERIIVNCMNLYHTTPTKISKYKEALAALDKNAYEFFLSDIGGMTHLVSNEYDNFVDYIIECALLLQRKSLTKTEEEIVSSVDEICYSIEKSRYRLDTKDGVRIFILLGDILKEYNSQTDKAELLYQKAIFEFLDKPDYSDLFIVNLILLAILNECEINYKINNDMSTLAWANKGYGILRQSALNSQNDITRCKFKLLIYAARACRNLEFNNACKYSKEFLKDNSIKILSSINLYDEAEKLISNKYKADNTGIDLYIKLIYEICVNKLMSGEDISNYGSIINELNQMNNMYLNSEGLYKNEYLLANRYIALLSAAQNNDCEKMEKIIANVCEDNIMSDSNMGLLDMLYVYSFILRKNNRHQDGISVLSHLINNYLGHRDKAICLQNKALSHMNLYKNDGELKEAEES